MNDVTVLVAARRGGDALGDAVSDVVIVWEDRPVEMPPEAAAFLEARWREYECQARVHNRTLFNGPITQLLAARRLADGRVQLTLGPSDFKTFLVTCLRDRPWFKAQAPRNISRALGNSALLTHEDAALLGVRSDKVSVYAGRAHLIGGVLDRLGTEKFPASAAGLLAHLELELSEEAQVRRADLAGEPRLLFVGCDEFLGQPEAVWHWPTRTPLRQIATRLDPVEHSGFVTIQRGHMEEALWAQMTPEAREAWRIWSE